MAESSSVTFGYWHLRGRGAIPRLVLEYTGTKYDEKRYVKPEEWFGGDKNSIGFDFPNLPYLVDGDFKLTETRAIVLYVIRRSGHNELLGKDVKQQATQGMIGGVVEDVNKAIVELVFNPDYETVKAEKFKGLTYKLDHLKAFLGTQEWLAGFFSVADFTFYETWNYIRGIFPEESKAYESFNAHHDRFEAVPQIKAYLASDRNIKAPYLPKAYGAKWTG
jgi:glutathione S-transferase